MSSPYYEIVTYTVEDAAAADAARTEARRMLQAFPGFIAWTAFSGADDAAARVDLVAWESQEEAMAASEAVATKPEFAAFRASVASIRAMGHYLASPGDRHALAAGNGIEIGRFRLKPGVTEEDMRRAHAAMLASHLSAQPGWRRQHLVKLDDGIFLDLAFAQTRAQAESICAGWHGQPDCEAFLALIEPEDMRFGTVC